MKNVFHLTYGNHFYNLLIKFPKNFHPVGVSYRGIPSFLATISTAPDVGMLLATPLIFYFKNKSECAANIARESEGVTKKFLPKIILRCSLGINSHFLNKIFCAFEIRVWMMMIKILFIVAIL